MEASYVIVRAPFLAPQMPRRHKAEVDLWDDGQSFTVYCTCGTVFPVADTSEEALAILDAHTEAVKAEPAPEVQPEGWLVTDDVLGNGPPEARFNDEHEAAAFASALNEWLAGKPAPDALAPAAKPAPTVAGLLAVLDRPWTNTTIDNAEREMARFVGEKLLEAEKADDEFLARVTAQIEAARADAPVPDPLGYGWPLYDTPCDECGDHGQLRPTVSGRNICLACIALYPEKKREWAPLVGMAAAA